MEHTVVINGLGVFEFLPKSPTSFVLRQPEGVVSASIYGRSYKNTIIRKDENVFTAHYFFSLPFTKGTFDKVVNKVKEWEKENLDFIRKEGEKAVLQSYLDAEKTLNEDIDRCTKALTIMKKELQKARNNEPFVTGQFQLTVYNNVHEWSLTGHRHIENEVKLYRN